MSEIILAGMKHGHYPLGGEVPRETTAALAKALSLLGEFAAHNPDSSVGIETASSKSVFQIARDNFRGRFSRDSPLTPRIIRQVSREIALRYAANASAKHEFESTLSRFRSFSDLRRAVLAGVFGVYEALHLRAEELGIGVEAIDDAELRRKHIHVESDLQVQQSEEQRAQGVISRAIAKLVRRRDAAGSIALSDRQNHMHRVITRTRLPLYFLGRVSAKAVHRSLSLPSRVVEITS